MTRLKSRFRLAGFVTVALLLAGIAAPAGASSAPPSARSVHGFDTHLGLHGEVDVNVCSKAVPVGYAHCDARKRTSPGAAGANSFVGDDGAYSPAYLQSAYNAPIARGAGQTVAVVDAFDAPNAESDLAIYRAAYSLPPCTTANGCFKKIDQRGGTSYPPANSGWEQEISLDVDMVSALCPNCKILLVEADDSFFDNLGAAVNKAVQLGANVVSNSYGGSEFSDEASFGSAYFDHPGVAILASTGDSGYGVNYPAASPDVVAVGGTTLFQSTDTGTRDATETVWAGAGSGCSAYEPKPVWQTDTGCSNRTVADVAAVADPSTGVWVYDGGWGVFGGTSAASPIVAGLYALAENGASSDELGSYPYAHVTALNDVVAGSNGSCGGTYLCTGAVGYDGPTGLGTPNGADAFAGTPIDPNPPDFSVDATPVTRPMHVGNVSHSTVTVTPTNGFTGDVHLSATVSPALGLSKAFVPTTVTVGAQPATSTLTYTAHKGGTYTVTITATSGTITRTRVRHIYVNDFSMTITPASLTIVRGSAARFTLTITPAGSFNHPVALSITGLRTRDTVSYQHNPAPYHGSQVITIKTSKLDAPGTLTLQFKGNSGSLNHMVVAKLVLK
jgi:hypothetical protein